MTLGLLIKEPCIKTQTGFGSLEGLGLKMGVWWALGNRTSFPWKLTFQVTDISLPATVIFFHPGLVVN